MCCSTPATMLAAKSTTLTWYTLSAAPMAAACRSCCWDAGASTTRWRALSTSSKIKRAISTVESVLATCSDALRATGHAGCLVRVQGAAVGCRVLLCQLFFQSIPSPYKDGACVIVFLQSRRSLTRSVSRDGCLAHVQHTP